MKYEFDPDNEGTNDILLEIVRLLELIEHNGRPFAKIVDPSSGSVRMITVREAHQYLANDPPDGFGT